MNAAFAQALACHSIHTSWVICDAAIGTRFDRLRAAGFLEKREMARLLKISVGTLKTWYGHGLVTAKPYDDKGSVLYQPPTGPLPRRGAHKFHPRRPSENRPERRNEV